jgi:hypothetical protein
VAGSQTPWLSRQRRGLVRPALAIALAVGPALAGCSQSVLQSPAVASGSAAPTATASDGSVPCQAAQVRLKAEPSGGLLGTTVVTLAITNISATACTLTGYPQVQVFNADRRRIAVKLRHGELGPKEPTQVSRVLLAPGRPGAEFGLSFTDHPGPASPRDCRNFTYVRGILPGKQATNFASTGSLQSCGKSGPEILVSPVGPANKA